MRHRLAASGLLLAMVGSPASADMSGLAAEAQESLQTRADAMSAALLAGDGVALFDLLPPPVVVQMAATVGETPARFRIRFIDNLLANRPNTGVDAHRLDLADASLFDGADGTTYAIIPTESLAFDPYRGRFRITGTTVGIPSSDTWHFVTIADTGTLAMLVEAYPALATAPLTPATLTPAP